MATFEQFAATKRKDPWDLGHKPRKVPQKLRFVRHQGRVFQVVAEKDGLLHCETLSGRVAKKVLHPMDIDC